jgi:N-acetylglucosamine-6-phosphate deacetylase
VLYIRPKAILTPGGLLEDSAVLIEGDRVVAVGPSEEVQCPPGARQLLGDGMLLTPGFIDLQINGAFGSDFTADPSSIWRVGALLPQYGVTAFLPTVITSPLETVAAAQEVVRREPPPGYAGAVPLGLHVEGPFLNPEKRGAHNPAYLRQPNLPDIEGWSLERGVRLVTLAPELPGARELISALRSRGVIVSAGHSAATFEQAHAGIEAGITYGTHIFNAMPPMSHREPGLAGALLADPGVTVGVIADGVHLHPGLVALIWRALGPRQLSLVTDAMAALGMPPGDYTLGDRHVTTDGKAVYLAGPGAERRLAGSVLSMDQAVRNLVQFTGCTPAEAVPAVTSVPASLLGLSSSHGRVAPGCRADFTLLDDELRVVATVIAGEVAYSAA